MSLRKRTHLMLLAAALLGITTFGAAQQPVATDQRPVFQSRVDLITTDVYADGGWAWRN